MKRAAGFTILELLIAVSLLSVLAVLSWRGMEAVINGRDAIVERSDELRALTAASSQVEEDLRRSWPVARRRRTLAWLRARRNAAAKVFSIPAGDDGGCPCWLEPDVLSVAYGLCEPLRRRLPDRAAPGRDAAYG